MSAEETQRTFLHTYRFLLRTAQSGVERIGQRHVGNEGAVIVKEEHIRDCALGDELVRVVVIIARVDHHDLRIVGDEELYKAVGVGVLEQKQDLPLLAVVLIVMRG